MPQLQYSLELPSAWTRQIDTFSIIIDETNSYLDRKDAESVSQAVGNLYELIYGLLEYLEIDALEIAKTQKIINNPRMKSYENQILTILLVLEELSQNYPDLTMDRYVLYLEVFRKFVYVDLDAINLFFNLITKINSKLNLRKIHDTYISDYTTFCLEIGILAFESKRIADSLEIFQEITKLLFEPLKDGSVLIQFTPFLGLAICYENLGNYVEASNIYFELYNRIRIRIDSNKIDEIPLQIVHEVMFFGYICSFLGDRSDRLNDFYSFTAFSEINVKDLMNSIHSMIVFGFPMFEAFKHINLDSITHAFNYYLGTSFVQSNQINNSLGLLHTSPNIFLPMLDMKLRDKGAQKAIVIVETQHLKDIQVTIGKNNLPALNVLPDISLDSNFVMVDNQKFYIKSQFAFGTSFSNDVEITVHYQKKPLFKRKLSLTEQIPPFFLIDIDQEITDVAAMKEGSIKAFDVIWQKDMSLVDIIKTISLIDNSILTFKNENEAKAFFKELLNLLKKLNLKEPEKVISELSKQDLNNMIIGKALKLVIIQRLSELEPNNDEIFSVIQYVASS